jgi:hypothetical protein
LGVERERGTHHEYNLITAQKVQTDWFIAKHAGSMSPLNALFKHNI